MNSVIYSLISQLEDIHHGNNWIGLNFEKMIDPLNEEEFFFSPDGFHSVAEILSHLTVWRNESLLKIQTGEGSITDSDPTNWKNNSELMGIGKSSIIEAYYDSLEKLLRLLSDKNDDFLNETYYDTDFKAYHSFSFLLYGMLHHDLYHLGQLSMLVKIINSKSFS